MDLLDDWTVGQFVLICKFSKISKAIRNIFGFAGQLDGWMIGQFDGWTVGQFVLICKFSEISKTITSILLWTIDLLDDCMAG